MGQVTRREFLRSSAGAALVGAAASLGWPDAAGAASKEVVVNFSGGANGEAMREAYFIPFEKETGIKVIFTSNVDFGKLKAMVMSGAVEWDMTELEGQDEVIIAAKNGWLEPLDYKVIKTEDLLPEGVHPYGIAFAYYSTVLAYPTRLEGKRPRSWAEFWDVKKFPGARALGNYPWANLEFAVMADGVPPNKLYPLDLDRAFRSLDRIKPHIKVWWKAGAQPAQMLADGEVDFTSAWNGRIFALQQKGVPVAIEWNQGVLHYSSAGIPKGAKNKENAMKFLAFSTRPDRQAQFAKLIPYPGLNRVLYKHLDPSYAKKLPTYPENLKKQVVQNYEWWVQNREKVDARWNEWITK